ncbi:hypothetical protein PCE1_004872 [Barthelona sp. PCE]
MNSNYVTELSVGLVREFLKRRGMSHTLLALEEEVPRTEETITSRSTILHNLHLQKAYQRNKEREAPLSSILEIFVEKTYQKRSKQAAPQRTVKEQKTTFRPGTAPEKALQIRSLTKNTEPEAGFLSNNDVLSKLRRKPTTVDDTERPPSRQARKRPDSSLVIQPIDDEEYSLSPIKEISSTFDKYSYMKIEGTPLTIELHERLGVLLFGRYEMNRAFHDSWRQGFFFYDDTENEVFGLRQFNGGPCAILAAIQARIIMLLRKEGVSLDECTRKEVREALVQAMAETLVRCDGELVLIVPRGKVPFMGFEFSSLDATEPDFDVYRADNKKQLINVINRFIMRFMEPKGAGVVSFVLSMLLSRGISQINTDLGFQAEDPLIAKWGQASQPLINLVLSGRAAVDVCNGDRNLDGLTFSGITEYNDIGFFSDYDFFNHQRIGTYLKNPLNKIWIVLSEAHITVFYLITETEEMIRIGHYDQMIGTSSYYIVNKEEAPRATDSMSMFEKLLSGKFKAEVRMV